MFRIALIWIYFVSLLICPLRCAKSMPLNLVRHAGQHVHCCQECSRPAGAENDVSTETTLNIPASGFPDSGCGCLACICKSSLCSLKPGLQNDLPESQSSDPFFPLLRINRQSSLSSNAVDLQTDPRAYGRAMRQWFQSWLI